jgi:putative molybdopterin biosynthesis protein
MSEEMLNTQEVARYLRIHEKQVYALIKAGKIPATRVTGKWLFPGKLIDQWITSEAEKGLAQARQKSRKIAGALLAAGSNDPVLDILQTFMRRSYPEFYIFSANTGSLSGLAALNAGHTDIAWSHLLDPESGTYNIPYLATHLAGIQPVVVNLFYRELGFLTAPGNPFQIRGFGDLSREGLRFINRQEGSGTRVLLDYGLKGAGIPSTAIRGYENEVYTHFEVGLAIASRHADAGIATIAVSKLLDLPFIPITRENFDMILDKDTFFDRGIQAFIEVLKSATFRKNVELLGSYDFKDAGRIMYATH